MVETWEEEAVEDGQGGRATDRRRPCAGAAIFAAGDGRARDIVEARQDTGGGEAKAEGQHREAMQRGDPQPVPGGLGTFGRSRSEERRVGKECGARCGTWQ